MCEEKLYFASDYQEGAHPAILRRLQENNLVSSPGYGTDRFSENARQLIRDACRAPDAEIHFLVGGTQANAVILDTMLKPYQGVIAPDTGHVSVHEAGAIEFGGHKVLTIEHRNGKISAEAVQACLEAYWQDGNHEHMVMPGGVYLSQPTEYGTLYSLAELEAIRAVCRAYHIFLHVDGARLAYALACPENDITLPDLARLCDVFYIGGTKCGTLFGEAVVFPVPGTVPHFFTMVKQHGALLAKGHIAGLQFETLFSHNLYLEIGGRAIAAADRIRARLRERGYCLTYDTPTNQIFITLEDTEYARLSEKAELAFFEKPDSSHTTARIATSWATSDDAVEKLLAIL